MLNTRHDVFSRTLQVTSSTHAMMILPARASLTLEEEVEEEQHLVSHSGTGSVMNPRPPCDRSSALSLSSSSQYSGLVSRRMPLSASVKSAFSNYVRSGCRGEPDGRTAVVGDSCGRESDAAFTPSPVDPVHRTSALVRWNELMSSANI